MLILRSLRRPRRQSLRRLTAGQPAPVHHPRDGVPLQPQGQLHEGLRLLRKHLPRHGAEHPQLLDRQRDPLAEQHRALGVVRAGGADRRRHALGRQRGGLAVHPVLRTGRQGLAAHAGSQTHRPRREQEDSRK